MAIECVNRVLELKGPPIYVFHEIVHNKHVVEDFRSRGVTFVDSVEQVPEASVLVYSAHGISPAVRAAARARRLVEIDATCPLVTKVHLEVLRFAREEYTILFIGHRNHDEAVGTVGEAPGSVIIVETPEEARVVEVPDPNRVACVTQTTLSLFDASQILSVLRERFPNLKLPAKEDICYATTNRQNAVSVLSSEVDLVLVIGSRNSSNSKRLVETAHLAGKRARLIDDVSELDPQWLEGCRVVLVTAGASAPEKLVADLLDRLRDQFNARVEERTLAEEGIAFELPRSLKSLSVAR
jgi:4-hydroxy-3-methylbut-2-enyl diphosphate reductase